MLSRMSRLVWSGLMTSAWAMGLHLWGQPLSAQGPEWVRQNPLPTGKDLNGVWGSSDSDV